MESAAAPQLSVLLPVRNAGRYLRPCLDDLLRQEGVAIEVVAVDDGSTDRSGEVLQERSAGDSRLRVIRTGGVGPAAALNLALSAANAPLIGQMEADDRCAVDRFARLRAGLEAETGWSGVVSRAGLKGVRTDGMRRYVDWQNRLRTPEQLSRARFIEIPALHQTGLYRRELFEVIGGFRDDPRWPLDIDFWLRAFETGARIGRLPRVLYWWRQHPGQSTRTSSRHRLEALQRCKAHFFARGPGRGVPLEVFGPGRTLQRWSRALEEEGGEVCGAHEWRPPEPLPRSRLGALRLFAFGMERARQRVRQAVPDFDPERDWFVA